MELLLKQLIRQGENSQLDFKKTITHREKIAKTIVSFANNRGGTILVGVRDDRQITGINPDEESYMLQDAAAHYCDPAVPLRLEEIHTNEGTVLLAHVAESQHKPHRCVNKHGEWHVYVRSQDQSVRASKQTVDVLRKETLQRLADNRTYTRNEQAVFSYLRRKNKISLKDYARLINVSKRRAARILTGLVLEGDLLRHDYEKAEFYTLRA
ncbi:Putative DNA-binding domain-containing protein [Catalinimonas alkaloidigena]|uniref:Putative DNA-binding domain-containing protein n=1 Tax=Catalinimonas alkaloidigena TaxID=1075417 RepID=A0A1G9E483_9BACT|nr:ATP-binding protein [Catalinimonas alkaloidigena]SDK70921.1 Putative DNA-binding domain-containing protein [Catalinimonas alkaloidigena]